MQRLTELQTRIRSLGELGEVIGALRAVSAARVEQAHGILDSLRKYTAIIQDAISEVARGLPLSPGEAVEARAGGFVVAFGSEHGFVGSFNERVLEHAAIERRPGDALLLVGSRANLVATERRERVSWSAPMASQVGSIDGVVLRVAEELARAGAHSAVERVVLVYTRGSGGGTSRIVTETLLPFDVRPYTPSRSDRPAALSTLPPRELLEGLVDELLFAELAHAAMESFASENAARLATMEAAADNVQGKLDDLGRVERELRQEEITTELLDVVTGAEAVTAGAPSLRSGLPLARGVR